MTLNIPNDKRLGTQLVNWMNTLHLSYEQREAFRKEFVTQGIFEKEDISVLEFLPMMKRIATASQWPSAWAEEPEGMIIHRKLLNEKYAEIAKQKHGKFAGHDVVVTLKNAGGTIKSWLMAVSSNCRRVNMYFKQLCQFSLAELEKRGLLTKGYEKKKDIMQRLELLHAQWSIESTSNYVLLPSRIEQLLCTRSANFVLSVELPNDELLMPDLVAWMNKLVLTFKQRTALRKALTAQKVQALASLASVNVKKAVEDSVRTCSNNCPQAFEDLLTYVLTTQKQKETKGSSGLLNAWAKVP